MRNCDSYILPSIVRLEKWRSLLQARYVACVGGTGISYRILVW